MFVVIQEWFLICLIQEWTLFCTSVKCVWLSQSHDKCHTKLASVLSFDRIFEIFDRHQSEVPYFLNRLNCQQVSDLEGLWMFAAMTASHKLCVVMLFYVCFRFMEMTMISTVKSAKGINFQTEIDSKIACKYCTFLTDLPQSEPWRDRCYPGLSLNDCNDKTIRDCLTQEYARNATRVNSERLRGREQTSDHLKLSGGQAISKSCSATSDPHLQANQQKEFIWLWQTAAVNHSS